MTIKAPWIFKSTNGSCRILGAEEGGTPNLGWASTIIIAQLLRPYDYGIIGMAGLCLQFALLISKPYWIRYLNASPDSLIALCVTVYKFGSRCRQISSE